MAARDGGDDEVAFGTYEVDRGYLEAETLDDAVGDGLQGVGEAARGAQLRHDEVQLAQAGKADIGL